MSREQLTKDEAIDKLRAQIQPEDYVKSLESMKQTYLGRAAELLGNRDLNAASGAIDERDVELVNKQLDDALADLSWRVDTIDERIKDFADTKESVTRPFERAPSASEPEEEMPDETEVLTEEGVKELLTEEGQAILEAEAGASMSDESQVDMARREMATPAEDDASPNTDSYRAEAEAEARGAADDVQAAQEADEAASE